MLIQQHEPHAMLPKYVSKRAKNALQYRRLFSGSRNVSSGPCAATKTASIAIQREAAELTQYEASCGTAKRRTPTPLQMTLTALRGTTPKLEREAGEFLQATKRGRGVGECGCVEVAGLDDFIEDGAPRAGGAGVETVPPALRRNAHALDR